MCVCVCVCVCVCLNIVIIIQMQMSEETSSNEAKMCCMCRNTEHSSSIQRTIELPDWIDAASICAKCMAEVDTATKTEPPDEDPRLEGPLGTLGGKASPHSHKPTETTAPSSRVASLAVANVPPATHTSSIKIELPDEEPRLGEQASSPSPRPIETSAPPSPLPNSNQDEDKRLEEPVGALGGKASPQSQKPTETTAPFSRVDSLVAANQLYFRDPNARTQEHGRNGCGVYVLEFLISDAQGKPTTAASGGDESQLRLAISMLKQNFVFMEAGNLTQEFIDARELLYEDCWRQGRGVVPDHFEFSHWGTCARDKLKLTPRTVWFLQPIAFCKDNKHNGFVPGDVFDWCHSLLPELSPRTFYVDTFFIESLHTSYSLEGELDFKRAARYFKKFNCERYDSIIFPVNVTELHWYAFKVRLFGEAALCKQQKFSIELVDGLPNLEVSPSRSASAQVIIDFLEWLQANPATDSNVIQAYEILCFQDSFGPDDKPPTKNFCLSHCSHAVLNLLDSNNKVHSISWGGAGLSFAYFPTTPALENFGHQGTRRFCDAHGITGFVATGGHLSPPVPVLVVRGEAQKFSNNTVHRMSHFSKGENCVAFCLHLEEFILCSGKPISAEQSKVSPTAVPVLDHSKGFEEIVRSQQDSRHQSENILHFCD